MPDYSKGKIYKIICHKTGLVYIGSTCEPTLARRLAGHRSDYKLYLKGKKGNITSFSVLENDVYEIVLIENFSCENKDELYKQENFFIENNICVNRYHFQTRKEYFTNNKDVVDAQNAKYYANNKDKVLARNKARYDKLKQDKIEIV